MNLEYTVAPSDLIWGDDLFTTIQAFKAGTFDSSEVYAQFAWLIVPQVTLHGASGPYDGYFAIRAPDENNEFSVISPIQDISVWRVVDGTPVENILYASGLHLSFAAVLAAETQLALEKLIFKQDDRVLYVPDVPDHLDDVLHGWAGDDDIEVNGSGGHDSLYGDGGNDRITIYDGTTGSVHGRARLFGYGGAGDDTVMGNDRSDHLSGGSGKDSLVGFGGDDVIAGGGGNDFVYGGQGDDMLDGGSGDDILIGSLGLDHMTGGGGADRFLFTWGGAVDHYDSGVKAAQRDVIADFQTGVDLLRVLESGLALVTLMGKAAFTGTDQVRWVTSGGNTTVYVNGDDDLAADMAITLLGVTGLHAADFLLT